MVISTGEPSWPPPVQRVLAHALARGVKLDIHTYPQGTRTAEDAARAIGCSVAQIVKSLVFMAGDTPVMALVSGVNRADTGLLAQRLDHGHVRKARPEEVLQATGCAIGGVPPFGHPTALQVFADRDLARYDVVWAAAGTPEHVFPIEPEELVRLAGAEWMELKA